MWTFFKKIQIIDEEGQPTEHFGDPIWVYYQYRPAKGDRRSKEDIYREGRQTIKEIRARGVPIAEGYGENIWEPAPELDREWRTWDIRLIKPVIFFLNILEGFCPAVPAGGRLISSRRIIQHRQPPHH